MSLLQALILGIVQGLTEFLPVSSSGHLAILQNIFGLQDVGIAFDCMLHVGTLIAVFAVYYKDIWKIIVNLIEIIRDLFYNLGCVFKRRGKPDYIKEETKYRKIATTHYRKFVVMIVISTIPVGIVGVLLNDLVEQVSQGLLIPGICLLITGVLLLLAEAFPEGNKTLRNMKYRHALIIGIAQACAVFPGISRSGSTISASLMTGMKKELAVKYSFILSIPAVLGAALKSLWDIVKGEASGGSDPGTAGYIIGIVAAAVVGYIAIKLLLVIVKNRKYKYFAFYCFAVGLFAIIGSFVIK